MTSRPPHEQDKFVIRLPEGMRHTIKEAAAQNRRSMNAEMVFHWERIFHEPELQTIEA